MNEIVINVEGQMFVVDKQALLSWLSSNAKTFANQPKTFNEFSTVDEQGRTLLKG